MSSSGLTRRSVAWDYPVKLDNDKEAKHDDDKFFSVIPLLDFNVIPALDAGIPFPTREIAGFNPAMTLTRRCNYNLQSHF